MTSARSSAPTQAERVLALLRARARERRPMNTVEFLAPTADGLPPILRLPARINELRDAGHEIETRRAPNRTADYYLHGEPSRPRTAPAPTAIDGEAALFDATDLRAQATFLKHWEAA